MIKALVEKEINVYPVMPRTSSLEQYFIEVTTDSANPFEKQPQPQQINAPMSGTPPPRI